MRRSWDNLLKFVKQSNMKSSFILRNSAHKLLTTLGRSFLPKPIRVLDDFSEYFKVQVIYIPTKLGIPDILQEKPRNSSELASLTGVVFPDHITRWMRAAESIGYFHFDPLTMKWENNHMSALLRTDHPNGLAYWVRHIKDLTFTPCNKASEALRTGENAFEMISGGMPLYQYLKNNPEENHEFNLGMAEFTRLFKSLREDYNWVECGRIVDIAGGNGQMLADFLAIYPNLSGILFELKHIVDIANRTIHQKYPELLSRIEYKSGSFLNSSTLPELLHNDCVTVKSTFHNFPDDVVIEALSNLKSKLLKQRETGQRSKLFIIQMVLEEHRDSLSNYAIDLLMFLTFKARERTRQEWLGVFKSAGFKVKSIIPTRTLFSIIVVDPIV